MNKIIKRPSNIFHKQKRYGEVAERLNAPVLKTGMGAAYRGFDPNLPPSTFTKSCQIMSKSINFGFC